MIFTLSPSINLNFHLRPMGIEILPLESILEIETALNFSLVNYVTFCTFDELVHPSSFSPAQLDDFEYLNI